MVAVALAEAGLIRGEEPSAQATKTDVPSAQDDTTAKEQDCGSIPGGGGGGDSVANLGAQGANCAAAKAVARAVTIEGADNGPNGFDCPDAQTYAAEKQTCTKGEATVTWDVTFE